mmetsp:Transcript_23556/g.32290  ORF Transcript_23556/g.32290 Transcript_23556/m.32290 type:complete len:345 (+) Transcript_23556:300-1334(+)
MIITWIPFLLLPLLLLCISDKKIEGICGEFIFERVSDIRVCSIIFADIDEKNSSIVAEVAVCVENGKVPEDFKKEDYKDIIRDELQQYIFDKLQLNVHVTVSKFTLLVPAASQNAMVCANVEGNGCGTVTVVNHPNVSCLVGITAKHVLSVENLDDRTIVCRAMSSNDNFLKSETSTPAFGYSSSECLHVTCDVGIMLPYDSSHILPNYVEKLGSIRFPTADEANTLKKLIMGRPTEFILAKQGCSTGRTTATIVNVTEVIICVEGREICPVANHGDSGALWIVVQSPGGLFNQYVVGICSYIDVEKLSNSSKVTIVCYSSPVWLWIDWFTETMGDHLATFLEL